MCAAVADVVALSLADLGRDTPEVHAKIEQVLRGSFAFDGAFFPE